jgi:hypothetical protein
VIHLLIPLPLKPRRTGYNPEGLNLKNAGKNKLLLALFAMAYSLAIREGWERRDLTPLNRCKDGSHCREVSIFRNDLAILTTQYRNFLAFIQYILAFFSAKNHRFCKNVQYYTFKDISFTIYLSSVELQRMKNIESLFPSLTIRFYTQNSVRCRD